jgi:hypothetical protein
MGQRERDTERGSSAFSPPPHGTSHESRRCRDRATPCRGFERSSSTARSRSSAGEASTLLDRLHSRGVRSCCEDCDAEEALFARDSATSADGVWSEVDVVDRDLSYACPGDSEGHSTAHARSTSFDKWAEAGWHEQCSYNCDIHLFNFFWEVGYGDVIVCDLGCGPDFACCPWVGLKVVSVEGNSRWKFWVDYGADGGWSQIGPANGADATFFAGIPMAETGRRGGVGTGASDDHRGLKRKLCSSCGYSYWTSQTLYRDTISNWHREEINEHHYTVEKDP